MTKAQNKKIKMETQTFHKEIFNTLIHYLVISDNTGKRQIVCKIINYKSAILHI